MRADPLLPALLAAERALGRLDQALSDPARRHRARCDSARRAAAALVHLDGHRLDPHDFQRALAAPDQANGEALRAALLSGLLAQLPLGLTATATPDPTPGPRPTAHRARPDGTADDLVAATRAAIAALDSVDLDGMDADREDPEEEPVPTPVARPLPPWTSGWLDELHRRWNVAQLGRPVPPSDARRADGRAALAAVEEALATHPGLLGAAAAIRGLARRPDPGRPERRGHADDDAIAALTAGRTETSWWSIVVWLAAPGLIQVACRLHFAWPALTPALARDVTGYRLALEGTEAAWTAWFLGTVQDLVGHELERLRHLDLVQERWEERIAPLARRSNSRLPDLLPWLHERPAFTVSRVAGDWAERFGLSLRGAHLLTEQLAKAGVVQDIAGQAGERFWAADLSFLPAGR
ncbi:hypothetical protein [Azospirillum sp. SYSU D00513]|uniref:hypothetical protein n=1 Tax=Azospirillum sp. SYSU D00513 TaxID=2812561 RepID=UPI001A97A6FC|nr:hypothetical protein [Azospirillum sp. SYSU D00513]